MRSVPDGWTRRFLTDLVGLPGAQVDPTQRSHRDLPLIAPDHVEPGTGRLISIRTAAEQGATSGKYVVQAGDVVYSKIRPSLRKAVLASFPGLCSADMYPLRSGNEIEATFLLAVLLGEQFSRFADSVSGRSGIPKINRAELAEYQFPLPPVREQRRIVDFLNAFDDEIEAATLKASKLRLLRSGVLRHSMAAGLGLIGSVEASRFRAIDGFEADGWSAIRLGSLLSRIEAGNSPDLEDRPAATGEWGVLKVSAVGRDGFRPDENKVAPHPALHDESLCIREGDLIMTRANTADLVGLSCIVEASTSNLMLCDKTLRLVIDGRKCSAEFVNLVLEMEELRTQIQIAATGTSGSMKNISQSSIRSLVVPYSATEFERICRLDAAHRKLLSMQQAELVKLRDLKQGIMEDLLAGRIRV